MSEQELFDLARQRIDRRNRRWLLWAVNLGALILSVAGIVLLSDTPYETIAAAVMLACAAIFVPFTIISVMIDSREDDIEKEVDKLREAFYEKPKRLHTAESDENIEDVDWEDEERSLYR